LHGCERAGQPRASDGSGFTQTVVWVLNANSFVFTAKCVNS
jgi:hypothetical protein